MKNFLFIIILSFITLNSFAQTADTLNVDYGKSVDYTLAGVTVEGIQFLDKDILITIADLKVGSVITVPGNEIAKAIQNLWKQGLFANVQVVIKKIEGDKIYLAYVLQEKPRLTAFTFKGIRKGEQDDLRDKLSLIKGKTVTENLVISSNNIINDFYLDKGFLNVKVDIQTVKDTATPNSVLMFINIDKGNSVKIDHIVFEGNTNVKAGRLRRAMKNTKQNPWYSIFSTSKFMKKDFADDKNNVVAVYNTKGFRDAKVESDTVVKNEKGNLDITIKINEGNKYYFRNITFSGNSKYSSGRLDTILSIKPGEIYNEEFLNKRLFADPNGNDISSLYMDDGYLFFSATPVEVNVVNDSVDLEIRIYEGPQATINNINISGNSKTAERVIRRVIRTLPGNKFSRADVIRTQREIATLGVFNPEAIKITPEPHPENGTVDINYEVEEKPSDQFELSAGYGGATGIVGALGVSFNNFSLRNMFAKGGWDPIPSGDLQRLSMRVNSSGKAYQSYNLSFTEPYLGGHKPNSFSVGGVHTRYTNYKKKDDPLYGSLVTNGGTVGYGVQLKWPDDYFTLISSLDYQNYRVNNYATSYFSGVTKGSFNNLGLQESFSRNSVDNPQFPMRGSSFSLTAKITPPYSLFNKAKFSDPNLDYQTKFKWVEYHKYRFNAEWYTSPFGKFVIKTSAKFGFMGYYNKNIGLSSFETYSFGGDFTANYNPILGQESITLRGYDQRPQDQTSTIFNKFTIELRYPFSTNPSTFVYGLVFLEGGNAWTKFKEYDPFQLNRAAGVGLRVFLPAFGLLGFDYGIGFDKNAPKPKNVGEFFSNYGKFNIILGFEPE